VEMRIAKSGRTGNERCFPIVHPEGVSVRPSWRPRLHDDEQRLFE
jgi:hypothetical protein